MATTLPASAQYAARRNGELVQLEDTKTQMVVTIIPSAGNITSEFKVKGQNVLRWPYASMDDFKARGGLNGIPFLAPWANRLDQQAFYANGKKYNFDMELGNVRGAIPIHGFLSQTDQWQVVEAKADARSAWVTSKLDVYKQPMWMKQFPFAHTIEMTHRLQDGVLQVQTRITNMAAEPMPVAIGFHPYYQLTDSPRDAWTVTIPAKTRWLLSGVKVPTGETEPADKIFPNGKGQLKDYNLDDVFSDLERDAEGRAHVLLKGKQQQLEIMLGPTFKSLVIYSPNPTNTGLGSQAVVDPNAPAAPARAAATPAGRAAGPGPNSLATPNFICFEPMAGITDAMNLSQKGLYKEQQYIAPNQTWDASFWVKPSGF
ncbi:MAG TPA: aldose 1-epimerase [Vicinamibacterales bacterium]|nr:aldose 1-epimerase [Vicinamibacterales bacterium]